MVAICVSTLVCVDVARAVETVEETYENGQTKLKFDHVDGKKTGIYLEYYEDGQLWVQTRYKKGKRDGPHTVYFENGNIQLEANYKRDKLHGKYAEMDEEGTPLLTANYSGGQLHGKRGVFKDGQLVSKQEWTRDELTRLNGYRAHPRSRKKIEQSLKKIFATRIKSKGATRDHAMALRRLNAYRYLCGLPSNIRLDPQQTAYAKSAVDILAKLGRQITHTPENPGLPEEQYRTAYKACSSSNLASGSESSAVSVDMYMFDSDRSNIDLVGHRMWCLSRMMGATGFGRNVGYYAMFVMDSRGRGSADWNMVCFPPPGYIPVDYFQTDGRDRTPYAWSIALNPRYYEYNSDFQVEIFPLDDELNREEPLIIKHTNFADPSEEMANSRRARPGDGSDPNAPDESAQSSRRKGRKSSSGPSISGIGGYTSWLVFQPQGLEVEEGRRYWLKLSNIRTAQGKPTSVQYLVEFIEPVEGATIGGKNGDPDE